MWTGSQQREKATEQAVPVQEAVPAFAFLPACLHVQAAAVLVREAACHALHTAEAAQEPAAEGAQDVPAAALEGALLVPEPAPVVVPVVHRPARKAVHLHVQVAWECVQDSVP